MIVNYDYFGTLEQPELTLCNPNDIQLGQIDNIDNLVITPEFNALSEMTLDIYKYYNGDKDCILPIYNKIKNRREILVDDLGYFIITTCKTVKNNGNPYKSITCYSCESELTNNNINYLKGTYKFYNEDSPLDNTTLMGNILMLLPRWTIGTVESAVSNKYRTFDVPEDNIFNFLMTDVEDTYECIFDFDIMNRVINVYDANNYVHRSSILLSTEDVLTEITENTKEDNIFTCCTVEGDNELGITDVNPLGTSVIYNFDNVTDLMTNELANAVTLWKNVINNNLISYSNLLVLLKNKNVELTVLKSELNELNELLKDYNIQLDAIIANDGSTTDIKQSINNTKVSITNKNVEIETKETEIDNVQSDINTIHTNCSLNQNFTTTQIEELSSLMFCTSFKDDNICITDEMTYEEIQTQKLELYNHAVYQLSEWAKASCEFEIDTTGFIFDENFKIYAENLIIGNLLDLELDNEEIGSFILLKYTVNYSDKSLSMTLGNRYRSENSQALFSDDANKTSKAVTTLTYERTKYGKAVNSGLLSDAEQFMNNAFALNKNAIVSENGQSVEITDSGYHGRKVVDGVTDDEQIAIVHNKIAFTDDNWDTIKTAVGKVILDDNTEAYGIIADAIVGKMIVGSQMSIQNEDMSFVVDENGVQINGYARTDETITEVDVMYALSISNTIAPTDGWTTTAPEWENGKYMWQKTVTTYADNSTSESDATCISGANGQNGQDGSDGQNGQDGRGISSSSITYQEGISGTIAPTGTWSEEIPTVANGNYLWIRTIIQYTDNTTSTAYAISYSPINGINGVDGSDGVNGTDGRGISSTEVKYQASTSGTSVPTGTWSEEIPDIDNGNYLWTRTIYEFTDNTTQTVYSVGYKGLDGQNGTNGISVSTVINYYLATSASSGVTTSTSGWTTSIQTMTSTKCYLWNYEIIKGSDNSIISTTSPVIIGHFGNNGQNGQNGQNGSDGVGISSINEHYAVSTSNSTAPTTWYDTVQTMTSTNKYLWNYETINYSDGTSDDTLKRVIGAYGNNGQNGADGQDGVGVSSITEEFYLSTSKTTQSGGSWTTTAPTWQSGKYIWTRSKIIYTNSSTPVYTTPCCDSSWEAANEVQTQVDQLKVDNPLVYGTQTGITHSWTGNVQFATLSDGQRITYWLPYNGNGTAVTLNLTLSNGTTTGALYCYYGGTSRLTTHYPAGSMITMIYRTGVSINGSSTTYSGWWADANYDSGNTFDRILYNGYIKASSAITGGNIIVGDSTGYHHLKSGTAFNATYPILYCGSSIASGSTGTNNYLVISFGVSNTQAITLTAYSSIYIKGTLSGINFTPVSTAPLTQTVPTTHDGYYYMLLGTAYSSNSAYLVAEHPIFKFVGDSFRKIDAAAIDTLESWGYNGGLTKIDGGEIQTGSIIADKINVTSLSSLSANLGTVTAGILKSTNYVSNTSGMQLNLATGVWDSKYFKLSSTGAITATSGTIGGMTLVSNAIYSGTNSMTSTTAGIYLGTDGFRQYSTTNAYCNIQNGILTAKGANITGTITSTSGTIGGMTLVSNAIYSGTNSMTSTVSGIYLGTSGFRQYSNANAYCNIQGGVLTAKGANITGVVTATSGTFTGTINAIGGTIGTTADKTWVIGGNTSRSWIYNGRNAVDDSTSKGVSLGTNGIAVCGDPTSTSNWGDNVTTKIRNSGIEIQPLAGMGLAKLELNDEGFFDISMTSFDISLSAPHIVISAGSLIPDGDTVDLGLETERWSTVYTKGLNVSGSTAHNGHIYIANNCNLYMNNAGNAASLHVMGISTANNFMCGATTINSFFRGATIYFQAGNNNIAYVSSAGIIPTVNNGYNLGSSSYKWNYIYSAHALQTSDRNLKTDIAPIDKKYVDMIMDLKPSTYKLIGENKTQVGLIAQEVEEAALKNNLSIDDCGFIGKDKDLVDDKYYYSLDYSFVGVLCLAKVQEYETRIKQLEDSIKDLTNNLTNQN